VVDAATLAAGPLVATTLGEFGADVIKSSNPVRETRCAHGAPEVAEARAIIADYRRAEADGRGAIGRDGQLVDAAMMRHAENVLRRAAPFDRRIT
jgi:crotonobetainyl-CoA:carnitine CoA-transferase CaiB-like acyl-CoA transferase